MLQRRFCTQKNEKWTSLGYIRFKGKKYEVGLGYIGRMVEIAYDTADISPLSVEDSGMNTPFRINELSIRSVLMPGYVQSCLILWLRLNLKHLAFWTKNKNFMKS